MNLEKQEKSLKNAFLAKKKRVYSRKEMALLLAEDKNIKLSGGYSTTEILKYLVEKGILTQMTLKSDDYQDIVRFGVAGLNPNQMDLALSIKPGSFLSHGTAVFIHGLTDQIPKMIYVNKEQSAKPDRVTAMSQSAIDLAFQRTQRSSAYIFRYKDCRITVLSGKQTGALGVETLNGRSVTGIDRTLIDICVRPRYAGGVFQVAKAFQSAVGRFSLDTLIDMLKQMKYKYPYHQSLGFYLTRAGVPESELEMLKRMGKEYQFYLDYSMSSPQFDSAWSVYYPLGV